MSDLTKIVIGIVVAVSTLGVLIFGGQRFMDQRRFREDVEALREELYRARVSSDRCRGSLTASEAGLQTLTRTIDSLRSQVDSFEALAGGRVPGDSYEEYLVVFDTYNDSVAVWEVRSERLLAAEAACRGVIEDHNALSDSILRLLDRAGLE